MNVFIIAAILTTIMIVSSRSLAVNIYALSDIPKHYNRERIHAVYRIVINVMILLIAGGVMVGMGTLGLGGVI